MSATSTASSRWAVVTGASRGIGKAIAIHLADSGYSLHLTARTVEGLAEVKRETEARGANVCVYAADLASAEATRSLAETLAELPEERAPSVLVNNAGIALSAPLAKTTAEDFERVMAINVRAPFTLCQALMPRMAKRKEGRVLNIASVAAQRGLAYTSVYCASKHALLGLTRALAAEYGRHGVTINAV